MTVCNKCYIEGTDACLDCGLLPAGKCPADYQNEHARAYGEHIGQQLADFTYEDGAWPECQQELPNVATYVISPPETDDQNPRKRFVATYQGHIGQVAEPKIADRRVTILAANRDNAERCAEHLARDESWYLLGLTED